jgi:type II secretory pathway pseudopilin PulG
MVWGFLCSVLLPVVSQSRTDRMQESVSQQLQMLELEQQRQREAVRRELADFRQAQQLKDTRRGLLLKNAFVLISVFFLISCCRVGSERPACAQA